MNAESRRSRMARKCSCWRKAAAERSRRSGGTAGATHAMAWRAPTRWQTRWIGPSSNRDAGAPISRRPTSPPRKTAGAGGGDGSQKRSPGREASDHGCRPGVTRGRPETMAAAAAIRPSCSSSRGRGGVIQTPPLPGGPTIGSSARNGARPPVEAASASRSAPAAGRTRRRPLRRQRNPVGVSCESVSESANVVSLSTTDPAGPQPFTGILRVRNSCDLMRQLALEGQESACSPSTSQGDFPVGAHVGSRNKPRMLNTTDVG